MSQPEFREVVITMSPEMYPYIDREATSLGKTPEQYISALAHEEATRLFHVERSRPKPKAAPRPLGRPRIPAEQKRGMEAWEILEGIFDKLVKIKGEAFERLHGEQKKRTAKMLEDGDWQGLERFLAERGWEK